MNSIPDDYDQLVMVNGDCFLQYEDEEGHIIRRAKKGGESGGGSSPSFTDPLI
jgi:hypothetical protein